jgi:hypothetical protein
MMIEIVLLFLTLYVIANFVSAAMLGCMLYSAFVSSAIAFRLAVAVLAALCLGAGFYGLQELFAAARWAEVGAVGHVQVVQSIALAVVLVMIRLRQRAAGAHLHPRILRRSALELEAIREACQAGRRA